MGRNGSNLPTSMIGTKAQRDSYGGRDSDVRPTCSL
jgi:hypothetical protein